MKSMDLLLKRREFLGACLASACAMPSRAQGAEQTLYAVPNFHPACMGWLAPYHIERNYCLYSYLDHQDRALKDPEYRYALSEIPHLITMLEYEPARVEELKGVIRKGQCELVNAFVLEPSVSLSGGEALVMQGVEGLRWYRQIMDARPRHCWMIDTCGFHEQMAQIITGLGLETFVYCRYNPTLATEPRKRDSDIGGDAVHWLQSPDGTRTIAVNPGAYAGDLGALVSSARPVSDDKAIAVIKSVVDEKRKRTPQGAPLLSFVGDGDYSLSFHYQGYPRELLHVWDASHPTAKLRFSTLSDWFDRVKPMLASGTYAAKNVKSGSRIYGWTAFWVNGPEMKQRYRSSEHSLQAAEAMAAAASLKAGLSYAAQDFSNSWFLLALNMDRNTIWAAAIHDVFKHARSWDATDRFNTVDSIASRTAAQAVPALLGKSGEALGVFNPSNWRREGIFELALPEGKSLAGTPCQMLEDGKTALVRAKLPSFGVSSFALAAKPPAAPRKIALPEKFENAFYTAKIDAKTGALVSLKLMPSNREMLAGPANVVVAAVLKDKKQDTIHEIPLRPLRVTDVISSDRPQTMAVTSGPLATTVETSCPFRGGELKRVVRFYKDSPRIDFVTETNDVPAVAMVTAEFPLASNITEARRGIPYGFSHGAWARPNPALPGIAKGINPAIRWSHYTLEAGGGVAFLDRGVTGRELDGNTVIVHLLNANDFYIVGPAEWISGKGKQRFQYALVAHESAWEKAAIPRLAWDYNATLVAVPGVGQSAATPFLETSDNVVVEAFRRAGDEIEIRLAEMNGIAGRASVKVNLPHGAAAITDMLGGQPKPLTASGGSYVFDVRPQQIVTLRLKTAQAVADIKCLTSFDSVVPEAKRKATHGFRHPELKGHPPRTGVPEWVALDK